MSPFTSLIKLNHLNRIELYDIHHDFDDEAVVNFLKLHDSVYHTIREVKVGGPDDLGRSTQSGVIRILQAPKTVKVLDMIEWREAIKYLDQIPTQHLETLLLGNVRTAIAEDSTPSNNSNNGDEQMEEGEEEQQHPQIQTLQRCRQLRELRMPVLIDDLFKWAVHERHQRLEHVPPCCASQCLPSRYQWNYGPDPVQLENVHLSGTSTGPLISTLIQVVDAFRDSIQVLQSTSWMDSTETLSCCLNLSWTWQLPQLQVLDLQGEIACRFRRSSGTTATLFPQLQELKLVGDWGLRDDSLPDIHFY
ncbi:hypothetical protein BGZ58_001809 [Dissophora ornata]|nr:hypothetical protein BGZ58_001809 [Dissophora ornata]